MGEKSGGLTNMILAVVALVAILLVIKEAFPDLTSTVTERMTGVVSGTFDSYDANLGGNGSN